MKDLRELSFEPPTEEIASRLFDWASVKSEGFRDVAAWGVANSRGIVVQDKRAGAICNSGIRLGESWIIGLPTATKRDDFFNEWLIRESFAAPFIVAPSYEFARDVGFALSGDLPANLVVAILTLQRTEREHASNIVQMQRIVERFGVSRDVAFLIAFSADVQGLRYTNHNHNILGARDNVRTYFENFVNHRAVYLGDPFVRAKSYLGINKMWGEGAMCPPSVASVKAAFPADLRARAARVVVPNPFKPVIRTSYDVELWTQEALDEITPIIAEVLAQSITINQGEINARIRTAA